MIIGNKRYNVETSTMLAENGTNSTADFGDWYEIFYVTKKGNFFMTYWGGAKSKYAVSSNNGRSLNDGSGARAMSKVEAEKEIFRADILHEKNVIATFGEFKEA